jgi:hypothetical protein
MTLNLTASTVAGAGYSWTGPNGFASTKQNPSITNATAGASGPYAVTALAAGCLSSPATTTAIINPPAQVNVQAQAGSVVLNWPAGPPQVSSHVTGPWGDVLGAVPPRTNSTTAPREFYRIKLQ